MRFTSIQRLPPPAICGSNVDAGVGRGIFVAPIAAGVSGTMDIEIEPEYVGSTVGADSVSCGVGMGGSVGASVFCRDVGVTVGNCSGMGVYVGNVSATSVGSMVGCNKCCGVGVARDSAGDNGV